jgi:hypothetical protein
MRRFGFHHFGRGQALGLVALIGSVVSLAVLGALPVEAGTASTAPKPEAPGTGAPLLLAADVGSSITPPAGLYPAKPPAPDEGAPPHVPTGVGSGNTAASAQDLDCFPVQGFKSEANARYVVAQLDYGPFQYPRQNLYAMLRANATHVGAWEKFQFCYDKSTDFWSILSNANGRWAVAELDYPARDQYMLRANATGIGPREQYRIFCISGTQGAFTIKSAANERYVTAALDFTGKDYGMLRDRSDSDKVGPWEKFFPFPDC